MSYEAAITSMYALGHELAQNASHKFDLAHMRVLLAALGNPEQRSPGVLIAGTNGKGSTAAALGSILRASALKTGLYTSPHLICINERIRVNGESISVEHFARERVDLAVLEVGMGGRLDATNVIEPRVSVITDISLDHQKYLGNTISEIAHEKVGIIRPGGVVVTLPQQPEAN